MLLSKDRNGVLLTLISSKDNRLIKEYNKLKEKKAYRKETGLFVVEGARLSYDAVVSRAKIKTAFITEDALVKYKSYTDLLVKKSGYVHTITEKVCESMADTKTSQGVFCVVEMPKNRITLEELKADGCYLLLEDIQDPGNLGTILRTAEAMGIDDVMISKGSTDIYSPKVVRASMGAVTRLNILAELNLLETIGLLKSKGIAVYAAVANGGENIQNLSLGNGSAVVIGNEGNGLSQDCVNVCSKKATINMRGRAESLNAAAAATVLIWEMTKKP